jgi:hypothetical protein
MPYIYAQSVKTSETGIPLMRPMVMEYMDDSVCAYLDKQYCFGDSLIVAPIFSGDGSVEYYLPEDKQNGSIYTHLLTGETKDTKLGGRFIKEVYDYFSLPVWVKPNSIIVMGSENGVVYPYADGVEVHIYELDETETAVYNENGELKLTVHAKNNAGRISVNIDGGYSVLTFVFHNITTFGGFADNGKELAFLQTGNNAKLTLNENEKFFAFFSLPTNTAETKEPSVPAPCLPIDTLLNAVSSDENTMLVGPASLEDIALCQDDMTEMRHPLIPQEYIDFLLKLNGFSWDGVEFFGTDLVIHTETDYTLDDIVSANIEFIIKNDALTHCVLLGRADDDLYVYNTKNKLYEILDIDGCDVMEEFETFNAMFNGIILLRLDLTE